MFKKYFKFALMGVMLATASVVFAQEAKTAEELKAEREQLQTELKSKDTQKREEKLAKLVEKTPKEAGLQSVDGLAKTAAGVLIAVKSGNDVLAQYKREVTDNGNGEIEVTVHKAKLDDYVNLAKELIVTSALVATGTQQLKNAQADIKGLSPLKLKPASSSISFSTDALKLSAEEIALQTKLVNNLIATIKSSDNL